MAVGDISYYVLKPWITPDELFHRVIAEFVQEWSRSEPANFREVVVVASQHSGRAYAVSDLLSRNGIPHAFIVSTNGLVIWHDFPSENLDHALESIFAGSFDMDFERNREAGGRQDSPDSPTICGDDDKRERLRRGHVR